LQAVLPRRRYPERRRGLLLEGERLEGTLSRGRPREYRSHPGTRRYGGRGKPRETP